NARQPPLIKIRLTRLTSLGKLAGFLGLRLHLFHRLLVVAARLFAHLIKPLLIVLDLRPPDLALRLHLIGKVLFHRHVASPSLEWTKSGDLRYASPKLLHENPRVLHVVDRNRYEMNAGVLEGALDGRHE